MDQRDEFTKWMKKVEEAINGELLPDDNHEADHNDCGCGEWDCLTCFPDSHNSHDTTGELTPTNGDWDELDSIEGDEWDQDEVELPVIDEEDDKPKSGKGVKLGSIVQRTEFRPTGGEESPMTHGGDNLDEEEMNQDSDDEDKFNMISSIKYMQGMGLSNSSNHYEDAELQSMPVDELRQFYSEVTGNTVGGPSAAENASQQPVGQSTDASLPNEPAPEQPQQEQPAPEQPQQEQPAPEQEGEVEEATKPLDLDQEFDLDDMEDMLAPKHSHPLANFEPEDDSETDSTDKVPGGMSSLPKSSSAETRRKVGSMTPSDIMRDYMSRIDPTVGNDEPELPTNDVVIRTAADVPAVIRSAMQTTGTQTPEWHGIRDLPGFSQRNIRGMGRQVFGMFTNTPIEDILTIANVGGQGPNTDEEMRAVAGWLRDNAEDMGKIEMRYGRAIPGYEPEVKEYSANGVRFHVVRDPMGQYIYAYPDADAKTHSGNIQGDREQERIGGNMPRLREGFSLNFSLMEELELDMEIRSHIKDFLLNEAFGKPTSKERAARQQDKFSKAMGDYERQKSDNPDFEGPAPEAPREKGALSKRLSRTSQGARNLIAYLHGKHKLSNEASLKPFPYDRDILATQFKQAPDNFIIIQGTHGVAGLKPSKDHIDRKTAEYRAKGKNYNPMTDQTLKYQVIAFVKDGEKLDSRIFQDPEHANDINAADPTEIRTRVGKPFGNDHNPVNIFKELRNHIGEFINVWAAGFWGIRGETGKNARPEEIEPHVSQVERGKIAQRQAAKADTVVDMPQNDAIRNVFNRIKPILKPTVDSISGRIDARMRRVQNTKELRALADIKDKLDEFKVALDTDREVPMNGPVGIIFKQALVKASKEPSYSDEFKDYLNNLARPRKGPGGATLSNAGSTELFDVVRALRDILKGAIN